MGYSKNNGKRSAVRVIICGFRQKITAPEAKFAENAV